jgi:hypothetical protein
MAIEKPPYQQFMFSLLGMVLSTGLLMASLWQIEIASALPGDFFDFPFYLWRVSKWWARDFWYAINVLSWILAVVSTASLVRARRNPPLLAPKYSVFQEPFCYKN